jgi:hypothetical protein
MQATISPMERGLLVEVDEVITIIFVFLQIEPPLLLINGQM